MTKQLNDMLLARRNWEMANEVQQRDRNMYGVDEEEQQRMRARKAWLRSERHFKKVMISALSLIKMVTHARSGRNLEVMGLIQGKVVDNTFIVMDCFALPVEGTETRVNAGEDANAFMVDFSESSRELGRSENVVGWYHSHPGYGCWLSGIDVQTQRLWQSQSNEPCVAIVVDPIRTCAAGKVDIGAFRTFSSGYKLPEEQARETWVEGDELEMPEDKVADFGAYWDKYYQIPTEIFKSTVDSKLLDALWSTYWVETLSSSPLIWHRDYREKRLADLVSKIEHCNEADNHRKTKKLSAISNQCQRLSCEISQGLVLEALKNAIFIRNSG